jgi:hypothetical protein
MQTGNEIREFLAWSTPIALADEHVSIFSVVPATDVTRP